MIGVLTVVAGGIIACTFVLVALVIGDAHRAGVRRLRDAGEDVPWWVPHRDDDAGPSFVPHQRRPS